MNKTINSTTQRNYQLDVYKLIFSVVILIFHFLANCVEKDSYEMPADFALSVIGLISVHVFFIISGLLMTNSIMKTDTSSMNNCGEAALGFVLKKYKGIALPYLVALGIQLIVYFWYAGSDVAVKRLPMLISEIFLLHQGGTNIFMIQLRSWYISAMLITMLPFAYMLYKNKKFYLGVFVPLAAAMATGYMYTGDASTKNHLLSNNAWTGLVLGGIIRAISGLALGSIAWLIAEKLKKSIVKTKHRVLVTISEVLLLAMFYKVFSITGKNYDYTYVVIVLIPILIGIAFSQTSYVSYLFKSKIFSKFGSLSLAVYLLHWVGERIVIKCFNEADNNTKFLISLGITIISCVVYYLLQFLLKLLWNKKLKALLA